MSDINQITKNIGTVPTWGDDNFDQNVHENFSTLKEIVPQFNNAIDGINIATQTITSKTQEVSDNTAIVVQAKLDTQSARDAAINAKNAAQTITTLSFTNLSNEDILKYDNTTGKWINVPFSTFKSSILSGNASTASKLVATVNISGNAFDGSANIDIEDRLGANIPSATTTTIGTKGLGDYIHITGTTTITSFGNATVAGIRRTLIFDGALTLTHGTNLICPGATSITTVAGMVIEVVAESTTIWRVVSITHSNISMAELGYLDGVTSSIQTQFNNKCPLVATPTTNALVKVQADGTIKNSGVIEDTNGNIGFGTSPMRKFHIHDTSLPIIQLTNSITGNTDANRGGLIYQSTTGMYFTNKENGSMYFGNNGTSQLTLSSTGILTLSPTNNGGIQDGFILYDAGSGSGEGLKVKWSTSQYADVASIYGSNGVGLTFQTGGLDRMTLDTSGNLNVGVSTFYRSMPNGQSPLSEGSIILSLYQPNSTNTYFYVVNGAAPSGASTGMGIARHSTTLRSINAAGTINASGADYAEYEYSNDINLIKGQIVGFKVDGTLTDKYSESIRFAIKSTNPSIVGGDVWGCENIVGIRPEQPVRKLDITEQKLIKDAVLGDDGTILEDAVYETVIIEKGDSDKEWKLIYSTYEKDLADFENRLEAERQKVDRIAYAGKVPVNVYDAKAGQYIIASNKDDSIIGIAVDSPTFEQYLKCVGRVNKILDDGRAEVAVIIH